MNSIENANRQPVHHTQITTAASPDNDGPIAPGAVPPNTVPTKADGTPLFLQAEGESDRAFEAFRAYLELGPKRRYAAVAKKVGVCLRTIRRWAIAFDWRERLKTYTTHCAERYVETEATLQQEERLDADQRDRSLRQRQHELAQALLHSAERYLERLDEEDMDVMNFGDACKALDASLRLARLGPEPKKDDDTSFRDQITYLLETAYGDARKAATSGSSPATAPHPEL